MDFERKLNEALSGAGSEEVQEILERLEADYKKAREATSKLPEMTAKVVTGSLDQLIKLFNYLFATYQSVHSRAVGKPLPFERPMPEDIRPQIRDRNNEVMGALGLVLKADSPPDVVTAASTIINFLVGFQEEAGKLVRVINNLQRLEMSRPGFRDPYLPPDMPQD